MGRRRRYGVADVADTGPVAPGGSNNKTAMVSHVVGAGCHGCRTRSLLDARAASICSAATA
jgi:hypothetical protein